MSEKSQSKPDQAPSPIGEISQEPSAFEAFLDANQKKMIIIGILAILILVGYVIVDGLKTMAKKDAAAAVAAARTVPEYETVSKEHEGENAGGSALLLKSQLLWDDQQQQEAIDAVEGFISGYPEHPALGNAYATLGSYQQQLGNVEEAQSAFEKAAESESSASSLALLSLGDIALHAGENDKAREIYEKIITDYAESHVQVKSMAQQRLKLVGVESPTEVIPEAPKTEDTPITLPGPKPEITLPGDSTKPMPAPTGVDTPPAGGDESPEGAPDFPELDLPKESGTPGETETPGEPAETGSE